MDAFENIEKGLGIEGHYRLESVLAEGGMGVVYRAVQVGLDRPVALKVLKRLEGWERESIRRFLAEAQIAARISHPNVVRVLASGEGPAGVYIIYELIEGEPLRLRLRGSLPSDEALRLAHQASHALEAVHEAGVVHRDLKPENMLIDGSGTLKVTDLGVARDLTRGLMTRTGTLYGTPAYMSPEQCTGEHVTQSSDIYSLGIVLYELLTGSVPFQNENVGDLLRAHLECEPERPSIRNPALPVEWDSPVMVALRKNPEERYGSARDFSAAIARMARRSSTAHARPAAPVSSAKLTVARGRSAASSPNVSHATIRASTAASATAHRPFWRFAGLAALCLVALIGASWLLGPSKAPPVPTGSVISTPPKPVAVEAIEELTRVVTRQRSVAAFVTGTQPLVAELMTFDTASLSKPRLVVQLERSPSVPRSALPAIRVTTSGSAVFAVLSPTTSGPLQWSGSLPSGVLRDGYNELRLELPARLAQGPEQIRVSLEFERPAHFPAASLARLAPLRERACPEHKSAINVAWDNYYGGDFLKSLGDVRKILSTEPGCASALGVGATVFFRSCVERLRVGDAALVFVGASPIQGELLERPIAELRAEALELIGRRLRLQPGGAGIWRDLSEWFQRLPRREQRLGHALEAARWATLLEPTFSRGWSFLAIAEVGLLEGGSGAENGIEAAAILRHIHKAVALEPGNPGFHQELEKLRQRLSRAGAGRVGP